MSIDDWTMDYDELVRAVGLRLTRIDDGHSGWPTFHFEDGSQLVVTSTEEVTVRRIVPRDPLPDGEAM